MIGSSRHDRIEAVSGDEDRDDPGRGRTSEVGHRSPQVIFSPRVPNGFLNLARLLDCNEDGIGNVLHQRHHADRDKEILCEIFWQWRL